VANGGSTFSVIGADVTIRGDVEASADLHVDGAVVGDLVCASLMQGESSRIEGAITADSARLAGTVRGTINVRELVILRSARIEGDVHYEALTIEQGASVEGHFGMRSKKDGAIKPVKEAKKLSFTADEPLAPPAKPEENGIDNISLAS
jgi:cytoskeletal protein CcmA (bactofilin family)